MGGGRGEATLVHPEHDRFHAIVHAALDDAVFAEAWQEGMTMTAGEAVAVAVAAPVTDRAVKH